MGVKLIDCTLNNANSLNLWNPANFNKNNVLYLHHFQSSRITLSVQVGKMEISYEIMVLNCVKKIVCNVYCILKAGV